MTDKEINEKQSENEAIDTAIKNNTQQAENSESCKTQENAEKINVKKLTEKQAKEMLKELLVSNEALVNELEKVKADATSFKDSWYRTVADFENFKKRNSETRRIAYDDGKADVVKSLLVIGDSLDRALTLEMDAKTKEGVELIKKQFTETMSSIGVEEFNPIGQIFDPTNSEAIATVAKTDEIQQDEITNVYKKGYTLNGKTIRFAQVIVAK